MVNTDNITSVFPITVITMSTHNNNANIRSVQSILYGSSVSFVCAWILPLLLFDNGIAGSNVVVNAIVDDDDDDDGNDIAEAASAAIDDVGDWCVGMFALDVDNAIIVVVTLLKIVTLNGEMEVIGISVFGAAVVAVKNYGKLVLQFKTMEISSMLPYELKISTTKKYQNVANGTVNSALLVGRNFDLIIQQYTSLNRSISSH